MKKANSETGVRASVLEELWSVAHLVTHVHFSLIYNLVHGPVSVLPVSVLVKLLQPSVLWEILAKGVVKGSMR